MNDPHLIPFPNLEPGQQRRLSLLSSRRMPPVVPYSLAHVRSRLRSERGAATAEYAITTLATVVVIQQIRS